MAINTNKRLRFIRGTAEANNEFTGLSGELTIDTDSWTIRVHDGVTAGGHPVATLDTVPSSISDLTNDSGYITLADLPVDLATLSDIEAAVNAIVIPDTSEFITAADIPAIPADVSDLTDTQGLLGQGGGNSPVQPYLEVTNTPFITIPAVLGEPVTVTAAPSGNNAQISVVISEGPVIETISITNAGSGYVVGQRYRIWSYYIGGPDDASSIDLEVETVDGTGGIISVTNVGFSGVASNTPGTYNNAYLEYLPSMFDVVDTGLILTRSRNGGLFNWAAETEYDRNNYTSPVGTEWNADGWGTLLDLNTRSYTSFRSALNNQVGEYILGSELVMHDIINDKYYRFDFTEWGGNNGGYSYTRTLITDPNYFRKEDYGSEVDVIVADDGEGSGIGITRGNNGSIYNPYREQGYVEEVSPLGTLWNTAGWDDLSDIESREYLPFYATYGGNLGERVLGSRSVMYVEETGKYYAVQWRSWTQGGQGGGFSYTRKELDLTKLNEGIKFPDGTVLKSAAGLGRVKSIASGNRRIEEVTGNKTVSVTERVTQQSVSGTSFDTRTDYYVYLVWDQELYDLYDGPTDFGFEISLDSTTWYPAEVVGASTNNWLQVYLVGDRQLSVTQGEPIYYRVSTGGDPVIWWNKNDLPGGATDFRGAIIDYHAYTGESTIIGTIHIVDDDGEEHISHQEVQSGSTDGENDDLWLVTNEGRIQYRRIDGESKTLKIHWAAKVFYGSEYYD
jgi:hypothetical protein